MAKDFGNTIIGDIVWAYRAPDANRANPKNRPLVVISCSEKYLSTLAITSRLPQAPLPDDHLLLPHTQDGHPTTSLDRRSAVVCSWYVYVVEDWEDAGSTPDPSRCARYDKHTGQVPAKELRCVLERIKRQAVSAIHKP